MYNKIIKLKNVKNRLKTIQFNRHLQFSLENKTRLANASITYDAGVIKSKLTCVSRKI